MNFSVEAAEERPIVRPGIECLHHVGISVPKMDAAKAFYAGLLGMTVVSSRAWAKDARMDQILGLDGSSGEKVVLEGLNARIELWCFWTPVQEHLDAMPLVSHRGISHLCFEVSNLGTLYGELKSAGVEFVSEPSPGPTGSVAVYGRDPFGNFLEFFQAPAAS